MDEETKKYVKQLAMASTIGFQVVFAIFIGAWVGYWLDGKFGTLPWLTLIFIGFGIAAGFLNYYRFVMKQKKDDEKGSGK